MSPEIPQDAPPEQLQFDRAVPIAADVQQLQCERCDTVIDGDYYHVAELRACPACKSHIEEFHGVKRDLLRGFGATARAVVYGLGAAIAGAIIYYGCIKIANIEIGIVAILIGYMVGHMVRKSTGNYGGRKFQWIAAVLTYLSIAAAYAPFVSLNSVVSVFMVVALPVIVVASDLPTSLISAVIIAVGIHRAWSMTAGYNPAIRGPHRVGDDVVI